MTEFPRRSASGECCSSFVQQRSFMWKCCRENLIQSIYQQSKQHLIAVHPRHDETQKLLWWWLVRPRYRVALMTLCPPAVLHIGAQQDAEPHGSYFWVMTRSQHWIVCLMLFISQSSRSILLLIHNLFPQFARKTYTLVVLSCHSDSAQKWKVEPIFDLCFYGQRMRIVHV